MAEPVPQETKEAPASTPAFEMTPEIQQAIANEAAKQADAIVSKRVPGLQSTYEKQIAALRKDVQAAREANLTPEELQRADQSALEEELAKARREADALRAGRQYPEAFPILDAMQQAATVEDQLDILTNALRPDAGTTEPSTPAQSGQRPVGEPTPPVDPNRPLQQPTPAGFDPDTMDQSIADRIIDAVGDRWPGAH